MSVPRELCTREYKCEHYNLKAHPKACFFCDHLTDIIFDYTNGPYMFFCDKYIDDPDGEYISRGMRGECPDFQEEEE